VRIVSAVAAALSRAHGHDPPIIHRDLKPENIMILDDGTVKVTDFGVAKMLQAMHQPNTQSIGTLQYMSPEQIDARVIDHRADLYALGLIFYELLAGKPPFRSASPRQLLNMQCAEEPPPFEDDVRRGLPKGVEQLVFQLLEKAPEDRPYLATDVVERLEPFHSAASAPAKTATSTASSPASKCDKPSTKDAAPEASPDAASNDRDDGDEPSETEDDDDSASDEDDASTDTSRGDTVALVDDAGATREVPTRVAIGIVVGLSLAALLVGYWLRGAQESERPPPPSPFLQTTQEKP